MVKVVARVMAVVMAPQVVVMFLKVVAAPLQAAVMLPLVAVMFLKETLDKQQPRPLSMQQQRQRPMQWRKQKHLPMSQPHMLNNKAITRPHQ